MLSESCYTAAQRAACEHCTIQVRVNEAMSQGDLLGQLKIARDERQTTQASPVRWIVAAAVVVGIGTAGWWFSRGTGPTIVETALASSAAQSGSSGSVLDASGYVVARRQATVSAKITGKVREVLIEEGMRVEAGQIMATLDDTVQRADYALGQAQLENSRSQLTETEVNLRLARAELGRQQELVRRKLASAAALDSAQSQVAALIARLTSQRRSIDVSQRALALSQVALDDTTIRAPFAGIVVAKAAQPGEMISPISAGGGFTRTGIGTIVDMDSLEVEVDVNESFIGRVQSDMPVEATLNAYPEWRIRGRVIAVIPAADRTKATVRVRVALNEKDARIVPDMGVRVRFLEPQAENAAPRPQLNGVLVPNAAVVERAGQSMVFTVDAGKARSNPVTAGAKIADFRNITAGLAPGDTVIVSPPEALADGDAVAAR